jgi:hypothetical protein
MVIHSLLIRPWRLRQTLAEATFVWQTVSSNSRRVDRHFYQCIDSIEGIP